LKPCGLVLQAITQDVDLRALDVAVDLDAGDDQQRGAAGGLRQRRSEPVRRVVIGDGEHAEPAPRRLLHQLFWCEAAVRCRRVRVKVDRARHATHLGGGLRPPSDTSPQNWLRRQSRRSNAKTSSRRRWAWASRVPPTRSLPHLALAPERYQIV